MAPIPWHLGLSLPLGWRRQRAQGSLPGMEGDPYEFLAGLGFGYVEFGVGPFAEPSERELLNAEAPRCRQAGLRVALHPYLGGDHNCAHYGESAAAAEALESILAAASDAAERTGEAVTVNLHPAEAQYDPAQMEPAAFRRRLLERSRAFFREIECRLEHSHPQVRVVVEHQVPPGPDENIIRIGDTFPELLRVVERASLPLCWDTGHYLLAVERHGQAAEPPLEFIERVAHVHLHDVVEGRDHRPVTPDSKWPRRYLRMLRRCGFRGGVTLEYAAEAIRQGGGPEPVLRRSVGVLQVWAAEFRCPQMTEE
ncbi:MAG: sugar phosphate isomerase/epimerase family protein [Planctomycetota bacterium]